MDKDQVKGVPPGHRLREIELCNCGIAHYVAVLEKIPEPKKEFLVIEMPMTPKLRAHVESRSGFWISSISSEYGGYVEVPKENYRVEERGA